MSEIKLSIIIPFYNVEKYIATCLDSLYAQAVQLDNYEVIFIDDCSPDNSAEIVKEYQKKYSNFVVVEHEHNKGLGAARNTGVSAARGEYVWFVDSDDFISIDSVSKLISKIRTHSPDVLLFNYQRVSEAGNVIDKGIVFENSELMGGKEFVKTFFGDSFIYHLGYVWRCVYRTKYLKDNKFLFPVNVYWEDTVFFPKTILYASKVISMEEVFYNYRVNEDSISGKKNVQKANRFFQFSFEAGKELFDFSEEYKVVDQELAAIFRKKAMWYFNSFTKSFVFSSRVEKKKFLKYVNENKHRINEISDYISWYNKILMKQPLSLVFSYFLQSAFTIKEKLK